MYMKCKSLFSMKNKLSSICCLLRSEQCSHDFQFVYNVNNRGSHGRLACIVAICAILYCCYMCNTVKIKTYILLLLLPK